MTIPTFAAGECWSYRAPEGFEQSRIVIGAVVTFAEREPIVCCAVRGAPRRHQDGRVEKVTIVESALTASVVARDGEADVPQGFQSHFGNWLNDPRGLTVLTVTFEGWLDMLISRQFARAAASTAYEVCSKPLGRPSALKPFCAAARAATKQERSK